jgi:hypothetical protein
MLSVLEHSQFDLKGMLQALEMLELLDDREVTLGVEDLLLGEDHTTAAATKSLPTCLSHLR